MGIAQQSRFGARCAVSKKRKHPENRLREFRERAKLSRPALAEKLGLFFTAIQKWEDGDRKFTIEHMKAAAPILGVHWRDFITEEATAGPVTLISEDDLRKILEAAFVEAMAGNVPPHDWASFFAAAVHSALLQMQAGPEGSDVPDRHPHEAERRSLRVLATTRSERRP